MAGSPCSGPSLRASRWIRRLFAPTRGLFVAQQIKPQAKVYAESKGVACIQIDLDRLRGAIDPDLTLF